jgi:hypothetical protein
MMDQGTLRGAIIGCVFFGQIQREAWKRVPDVEIVAACDVMAACARGFAPPGRTPPV